MAVFVQWAVVNALTVLVLAPLVWGLARVCPWPSVRHTLWLVLLLKLLTPPILTVPIDTLVVDLVRPQNSDFAASPTVDAATFPDVPPAVHVSQITQPASVVVEPAPMSEIAAPKSLADVPQPAIAIAPAASKPAFAPSVSRGTLMNLLSVGLVVWLFGSSVFFAVQMFRLVRFARRLGRFSLCCDQLEQETAAIAKRLGLARYPQPRLVDGVVSPMLWGVGRAARVLFPVELFEQLNADARGTLLMHELAHFRRGDHWVRVLEFAATTLFWWHPVVWWALREIESAEEDCCDSWVMERSASSPKCYATALLDTIDFLCEQHPLAPPVASGLGNPTELRGRLVRIMTGTAQATLSPVGRALVWSLAVILPMQPEAFATIASHLGELLPRPANIEKPAVATIPREVEVVTTGDVQLPALPASTPIAAVSKPSKSANEWARAISPDRRYQVVARSPNRVELQDTRLSRTWDLTGERICTVTFVPGAETFVTGDLNRQVRLWDARTGRAVETLGELPDQVKALAVSPDGATLVAGSWDGTVVRWSLGPNAAATERHLALSAPVTCLRFAPDGRSVTVATGSFLSPDSGGLTTIDPATWTIAGRTALPSPIGAVAYSGDGQVIVAGAWKGTVYYLDADSHEILESVVSSKDPISAAAFSADTRVFPVLSLDEARAHVEAERARAEEVRQRQQQLSVLSGFPLFAPTATTPAAPAPASPQ